MSDELGVISVCYTVTFTRRSKHGPARMWKAITEPDEVSAWMEFPASIDLRVGGAYRVQFGEDDALEGVIVKVEPERALWYCWGKSVISWELEPDGEGCRYVFVHHGQDPRPIADEEGLAAGWHAWFDALDVYLDDGAPPSDGERRWVDLKPGYRALLEEALGDALTVEPGN